MQRISSSYEPTSMKNGFCAFLLPRSAVLMQRNALRSPLCLCFPHPWLCVLALMQKKPKSYSAALMDQIPIKYLVTQAQGLQQELGGEVQTLSSHLLL